MYRAFRYKQGKQVLWCTEGLQWPAMTTGHRKRRQLGWLGPRLQEESRNCFCLFTQKKLWRNWWWKQTVYINPFEWFWMVVLSLNPNRSDWSLSMRVSWPASWTCASCFRRRSRESCPNPAGSLMFHHNHAIGLEMARIVSNRGMYLYT